MLLTCWSVKGGSGTTVLAAALAVHVARTRRADVLAVDLAGDLAAAFGATAAPDARAEAQRWLESPPAAARSRRHLAALPTSGVVAPPEGPRPPGRAVAPGVRLLEVGRIRPADGGRLVEALAGEPLVVVDAGTIGEGDEHGAARALATGASLSLLVLRPCYLAVRRALAAPVRADAIALVEEPRRALRSADVAAAELADPAVTDVLVNGDGAVWVEAAGRLERSGTVLSPAQVALVVETIVAPLGLRADRSSPVVDARLPDGSRAHAVLPPLAVDGPCLAIRRFGARRLTLDAFAEPPVAALLRALVRGGANLVVAGGTGSGKTTLLGALAAHIPPDERILTVEDAAELDLPVRHVVRLEARPANGEGVGRVDIRELVRNALRMRPDRIVVGECRGGEALDLLQALNTGHDGGMSTCHANGAPDALRRLESMCLQADGGLPLAAIREQLGAALDVVVHVGRVAGGGRRVLSVAEVVPAVDTGGPCTTRRLADGTRVLEPPQRPARRTVP